MASPRQRIAIAIAISEYSPVEYPKMLEDKMKREMRKFSNFKRIGEDLKIMISSSSRLGKNIIEYTKLRRDKSNESYTMPFA